MDWVDHGSPLFSFELFTICTTTAVNSFTSLLCPSQLFWNFHADASPLFHCVNVYQSLNKKNIHFLSLAVDQNVEPFFQFGQKCFHNAKILSYDKWLFKVQLYFTAVVVITKSFPGFVQVLLHDQMNKFAKNDLSFYFSTSSSGKDFVDHRHLPEAELINMAQV